LRRVLPDQLAVKIECVEKGFRPEFHFLRDVALNECDADRLADGRRPRHLLQAKAAHGEQCRERGTDPPADEQGATQRDKQRQTVHAEQRREAGQRAGCGLRVTDGEPREARENPAFEPVDRSNQRGEEQGLSPEGIGLPALEKIAGEHRKQRHHGAEQEGGRPGKPPRHAAENREADEDPRNAGQEKAHPEGEAGQQALPCGFGLAQQAEKPEPDQRRQPEQAERGEATDADDAEGRGDQIARCRCFSQQRL
jgi:hypothetical protein